MTHRKKDNGYKFWGNSDTGSVHSETIHLPTPQYLQYPRNYNHFGIFYKLTIYNAMLLFSASAGTKVKMLHRSLGRMFFIFLFVHLYLYTDYKKTYVIS